jgi:small subunit ribosomal protein S20
VQRFTALIGLPRARLKRAPADSECSDGRMEPLCSAPFPPAGAGGGTRRERMAQHRSAEKRARQALVRRERNRAVRSRVRSSTRAVRAALAQGDLAAARQQLGEAERVIRRAASKGIVKKTTASRTVSRLAKAVHQAAAKA